MFLYSTDGATKWFISYHGTDASTCGATYEQACKTLDKLLAHVSDTEHEHQLQIFTDSDVIISSQLLVSTRATFKQIFI